MKAWHYTTGDAWERIRREGLVPHPIDKHDVTRHTGPISGLWMWRREQREIAHVVMVLERALRSPTLSTAVLRVRLDRARVLREITPTTSLELTHTGFVRDDFPWKYHFDEPCFVYLDPVAPADVELMAFYDLRELAAKPWARSLARRARAS